MRMGERVRENWETGTEHTFGRPIYETLEIMDGRYWYRTTGSHSQHPLSYHCREKRNRIFGNRLERAAPTAASTIPVMVAATIGVRHWRPNRLLYHKSSVGLGRVRQIQEGHEEGALYNQRPENIA